METLDRWRESARTVARTWSRLCPTRRRTSVLAGLELWMVRLRAPDRRHARELVYGFYDTSRFTAHGARGLGSPRGSDAASVPRLGWRKRALAGAADRPRRASRPVDRHLRRRSSATPPSSSATCQRPLSLIPPLGSSPIVAIPLPPPSLPGRLSSRSRLPLSQAARHQCPSVRLHLG